MKKHLAFFSAPSPCSDGLSQPGESSEPGARSSEAGWEPSGGSEKGSLAQRELELVWPRAASQGPSGEPVPRLRRDVLRAVSDTRRAFQSRRPRRAKARPLSAHPEPGTGGRELCVALAMDSLGKAVAAGGRAEAAAGRHTSVQFGGRGRKSGPLESSGIRVLEFAEPLHLFGTPRSPEFAQKVVDVLSGDRVQGWQAISKGPPQRRNALAWIPVQSAEAQERR